MNQPPNILWLTVLIWSLLLAIIPPVVYGMGHFLNIPVIFVLNSSGWLIVAGFGAREVVKFIQFHSRGTYSLKPGRYNVKVHGAWTIGTLNEDLFNPSYREWSIEGSREAPVIEEVGSRIKE